MKEDWLQKDNEYLKCTFITHKFARSTVILRCLLFPLCSFCPVFFDSLIQKHTYEGARRGQTGRHFELQSKMLKPFSWAENDKSATHCGPASVRRTGLPQFKRRQHFANTRAWYPQQQLTAPSRCAGKAANWQPLIRCQWLMHWQDGWMERRASFVKSCKVFFVSHGASHLWKQKAS